jgi:hypothetical protein
LELDVDVGGYCLRKLDWSRIRLIDRLLDDDGLMKIDFSCIDCLVAFEPILIKAVFQAVELYKIFFIGEIHRDLILSPTHLFYDEF